jgi:hypothetical protein
MAFATSKLNLVSPDDMTARSRRGSSSSSDSEGSDGDGNKPKKDDDKVSVQFNDYKRQNRFQIAPEGVIRLLAEAGASTRNRRRSGVMSGEQTPRSTERGARFGTMREYVSQNEEILGGYDGIGRSLRGDIGYTMRCRAEEGYGLSNVGQMISATTARADAFSCT